MIPWPFISWPRFFYVVNDSPVSLAQLFVSVCDARSWNLTPPDPASTRSPRRLLPSHVSWPPFFLNAIAACSRISFLVRHRWPNDLTCSLKLILPCPWLLIPFSRAPFSPVRDRLRALDPFKAYCTLALPLLLCALQALGLCAFLYLRGTKQQGEQQALRARGLFPCL